MPARPPPLLALVGPVARLITGAYYRVTVAGRPLPGQAPVLIVANHPNEVFDPLLVAAAAGRPVRFLAKAPLHAVPPDPAERVRRLGLAPAVLATGPMILADLATRGRTGGQEGRASRHLDVGTALVLFWWSILAMAVWVARGPLLRFGGRWLRALRAERALQPGR